MGVDDHLAIGAVGAVGVKMFMVLSKWLELLSSLFGLFLTMPLQLVNAVISITVA